MIQDVYFDEKASPDHSYFSQNRVFELFFRLALGEGANAPQHPLHIPIGDTTRRIRNEQDYDTNSILYRPTVNILRHFKRQLIAFLHY